MFVDASALLAMLTDEDDARLFAARLQGASKRLTSPLAVIETVAGLTRSLGLDARAGEAAVTRFLDLMGIRPMSLPAQIIPIATEAMARFPFLDSAQALSYACARYYRVPLLHRDAAFAGTDVASA